jgi:hypothetical protein
MPFRCATIGWRPQPGEPVGAPDHRLRVSPRGSPPPTGSSGWGARSSATRSARAFPARPQPARPVGAPDHRLRGQPARSPPPTGSSGWGARSSATLSPRVPRPQPARPVGAPDHRLRSARAFPARPQPARPVGAPDHRLRSARAFPAPNRLVRLGHQTIGYAGNGDAAKLCYTIALRNPTR